MEHDEHEEVKRDYSELNTPENKKESNIKIIQLRTKLRRVLNHHNGSWMKVNIPIQPHFLKKLGRIFIK
jgi:hypothetical protein